MRAGRRRGRPGSPGWRGLTAAVALLLATAPPPAAAQGSGEDALSLDAVEAALDSGRTQRAREALEAWLAARGEAAAEEPRARWLRARLTEDADSARLQYTLLAVDGGSPYGARARLRLAQLRLAEGQYEEALEDLELLRADFPGEALAAEAWLWSGRVHRAAGRGGEACSSFGRAEEEAARLGQEALTRRAREARRGCPGGPPVAAGEDAGRRPGAAPPDTPSGGEPGPAAPGGDDAGQGRFVVQIGAFSRAEAARALRSRAAEAGMDVRVVGPDPADGLHRVWTPPFRERGRAEVAARRLQERGFSAMVVEIGSSGEGR